jgi:hypothetical protein
MHVFRLSHCWRHADRQRRVKTVGACSSATGEVRPIVLRTAEAEKVQYSFANLEGDILELPTAAAQFVQATTLTLRPTDCAMRPGSDEKASISASAWAVKYMTGHSVVGSLLNHRCATPFEQYSYPRMELSIVQSRS